MPQYLKGDIFHAMVDGKFDLAIVFGHIGYNPMRESWEKFARPCPSGRASKTHSPISPVKGGSIDLSSGFGLSPSVTIMG